MRLDDDAEATLAAVSGAEIAALAGFYAAAATLGLTVVLDGLIATSAALVAERLAPGSQAAMLAGHVSAEPAHRPALAHLGLDPVLGEWGLRLGEGTGALLALPVLDAAAAMLTGMATLAGLGVVPGRG